MSVGACVCVCVGGGGVSLVTSPSTGPGGGEESGQRDQGRENITGNLRRVAV